MLSRNATCSGNQKMNKWDIFILGTDEVVATYDSAYFDAMLEAKRLSKLTGKTYCVGLHGNGDK